MLFVDSKDFPCPPIEGTDVIVPIRTVDELVGEGEIRFSQPATAFWNHRVVPIFYLPPLVCRASKSILSILQDSIR